MKLELKLLKFQCKSNYVEAGTCFHHEQIPRCQQIFDIKRCPKRCRLTSLPLPLHFLTSTAVKSHHQLIIPFNEIPTSILVISNHEKTWITSNLTGFQLLFFFLHFQASVLNYRLKVDSRISKHAIS